MLADNWPTSKIKIGAVIYTINPNATKIDAYTSDTAKNLGINNFPKKTTTGSINKEIIRAKRNQMTISLAKKSAYKTNPAIRILIIAIHEISKCWSILFAITILGQAFLKAVLFSPKEPRLAHPGLFCGKIAPAFKILPC